LWHQLRNVGLSVETPHAVSYTHLDVYKRQAAVVAAGSARASGGSSREIAFNCCILMKLRCPLIARLNFHLLVLIEAVAPSKLVLLGWGFFVSCRHVRFEDE